MSYLSFLGFNPKNDNKARAFESWSVKTDKNEPTDKRFKLTDNNVLTEENYNSSLKQLSEDYIKMFDEDGDKKISYDEFLNFNIKELRQNNPDITDEEIKQMEPSLRTIYSRLNVNNDKESKDKLDTGEIMNYFYSMDSNNDNNMTADGYVTQNEYVETSIMLSDETDIGDKFSKYLKNNYEQFYKKYK